ncbi:MAG TPA: DUF4388 domain-containing protein [Thermoanaerobaculia bacterium]|nr:DUF4388 domain-containing protein [Thermoanaerobaculia bacterium]
MSFEGEMGELELLPKLVELWKQRFTGALRFENDGVIKIVYFKEGNVLSASTNDRSDSVDEILVRGGKITKEHLRQALGKRKDNETLGDALLGLGFITRKELLWGRRVQLVGILRSILGWTAGNYALVEDYLPKREEGTLFYLPHILLELIVTETDRSRISSELQTGEAILTRGDSFEAVYPNLGLNEEADAIVALIDGQRKAADVAGASATDALSVLKLLHALALLGVIRIDKAPVIPEVPPVADTVSVPEVESASGLAQETAEEETAYDLGVSPQLEIDEELLQGSGEDAIEEEVGTELADGLVQSSAVEETAYDSEDEEVTRSEVIRQHRRTLGRQRLAWVAVILLAVVGVVLTGWSYRSRQQEEEVTAVAAADIPGATPVGIVPGGFSTMTSTSGQPADAGSQADVTIVPEPDAEDVAAADSEVTAPPGASTRVQDAGTKARDAPVTRAEEPPPVARIEWSSPLRARYDAMAREFRAASNPDDYTVQFSLVCQTESVTNALEAGGSAVWFVPIQFRGAPCFRLFWGRHATLEAAQGAVGAIPASLRAGSVPTILRVGDTVER